MSYAMGSKGWRERPTPTVTLQSAGGTRSLQGYPVVFADREFGTVCTKVFCNGNTLNENELSQRRVQ